jgi:hypothetical protein
VTDSRSRNDAGSTRPSPGKRPCNFPFLTACSHTQVLATNRASQQSDSMLPRSFQRCLSVSPAVPSTQTLLQNHFDADFNHILDHKKRLQVHLENPDFFSRPRHGTTFGGLLSQHRIPRKSMRWTASVNNVRGRQFNFISCGSVPRPSPLVGRKIARCHERTNTT